MKKFCLIFLRTYFEIKTVRRPISSCAEEEPHAIYS